MTNAIPVLLITGPVGVGKTTVSFAVSDILNAARTAHALVDVDSLRWCYPPPPGDRFHVALAMRNLAAVWANFRAAGAERLILADVLESREQLAQYREAVPGAAIQVVRLRATLGTLHGRVRQRETGTTLDWYLRRTAELATQMDRDRLEDLLVETDGRPATEIAREVLTRCGWRVPASA